MTSTSLRRPPDTSSSSSSSRDREAAESLMQLRQGYLGSEMHKKIAATYPTTTSTTNSPTNGVITSAPERSVSVIVSPSFNHRSVPISVVQPQKDVVIESTSLLSGRQRGSSVVCSPAEVYRVSRQEEDESSKRNLQNVGTNGQNLSSPPVSFSDGLVNSLGAVARTELDIRNIDIDLPGTSFHKGKPSSQQLPLDLVSSNAGSYPKKKDFFSRSPPLVGSSSATHPQFSFDGKGINASQPFVRSNSFSSPPIVEQQQLQHHQEQRLVSHNHHETSWLSIPVPGYRPIMNLRPSSSNISFPPGTTFIRISDPGTAQQLSSRNTSITRNPYGGEVEWRQHKQSIHENQRIKQIKSKKKVFRTLIQINGDISQPIIVDGFTIQREAWAKAFLQTQICHSAAILFKAIFTPDEIQNCTLAGRNGTSRLDLKKRAAIFRAVGWMKNKNQNPYSFDSAKANTLEFLTDEEKMMIEKKVFVERRYQTSRKIKPNSERVNSTPLKRPLPSMVESQRQTNESLKFLNSPVITQESTSLAPMSYMDMKPTIQIAGFNSTSPASQQTISIPNLSVLEIKQEKDDDPNTGSEEEDQFMKLASTDELEGLPPKIAKMSTQ